MTWYSSAESNPFFKQIWTGRLPGRWVGSRSWGVPGNGCVASQRAKAQSLLEIVDPTVTTPLTVSRIWVTSVAWLVSSDAGRYGIGLFMTLSGWESGPLRLTMRPRMFPLMDVPSRFLATGTLTHSLVASTVPAGREMTDAYSGTVVAPALSPCQPLLRPISPRLRSATAMVIRPPRFGTSCHMKPLACDMSTGFTTKNEVTYRTLPSESVAERMSVMIEL